MPILPREIDIYPENLLEQDRESAAPGARWWALYTLARREKELMRRLRKMQIPFYSPLVKRRSRSPGGRWIESHVPIFPGYVFLCGCQEQRQEALRSNCISRCLEVRDFERLTTDLRQIKRLIDSEAPLTPEARLEPGKLVRIRSGPMAGLEGVVVSRRGKDWLVVHVQFLQQGAAVVLEDFQFEEI